MHRPLLFLAAILSTVLGVQAAVPREGAVPALVMRAASANATSVRGVVGMSRHFSTVLHSGPIHHTEESDSGQLMQNGAFVKIAYHRIVDDGRAFTKAQIAQRDAQTNQDWALGKIFFKEPYDRRFIAEYTYDQPKACTACPPGTLAVNFASSIRDAQHGSGTMWIEATTARVVRLTYVPNVLPPHATFGTVTEFGGNAMSGTWYVVRIEGTYLGRAFMFKGTGTFTGVFDHFRRFSTVAGGMAALTSGGF